MSRKSRGEASPDHTEELLDEALKESFPASDPVALVAPGGGITGTEALPDERRPNSAGEYPKSAAKKSQR